MPLSADQKRELEAAMREFVGKPIGPPFVGRDPVNEPMIRQWCDAMGDRNPVYWDAAAASSSVHGGIVAPPTMLQAWTMQGFEMAKGYDEPRNNEHRIHKLLTRARLHVRGRHQHRAGLHALPAPRRRRHGGRP